MIPVILLTITDNKGMGYALGASDYLTKPIDPDQLASVLKKYRCDEPSGSVLIVDDDATARLTVSRQLKKRGWLVSEAENGRVALERIAANKPEIIFLDLRMPEMDGFEFIMELRKTEAWRDIPIAVVTGQDLSTEDHRQLNGCVQKILQKGAYNRDQLAREACDLVKASVRPGG